MKLLLILLLLHTSSLRAFAKQQETSLLRLHDVELQAVNSSNSLKASHEEWLASTHKVDASNSFLFPKVSLEGTYKYISEVPTLKFPGGTSTPFGDHQNYSLGPSLSWNLLDFGAIQKLALSAESQNIAKSAEKNLIYRQTILAARISYFKIQLRTEQQRLISNSLKLAESQYRDIQNRKNAGSSNRIDLLAAHKEVLNLRLQSRQLQSDFNSELKDLFAMISKNEPEFSKDVPEFDSIQSSLLAFSKYENSQLNPQTLNNHPLIKLHSANAESLRWTSESFKANELPKLTLLLRTSIDYPNGPLLESFNQNSIGINLSMPLYERGRTSSEASEKKSLSIASEYRREQVRIDFYRDWKKAKEQLQGFRDKTEIHATSVQESDERAKLVYGSYLLGRASFLEVQSANLHTLEAKVQATMNDIQILNQLAYLASITEEQ